MPTVERDDVHAERMVGARTSPLRVLKHAVDRIVAAFGLLVTAPLIVLIAVALRAGGGSVLRREQRVGDGGREFTMLAFAITPEMCRGRGWRLATNLGVTALPQLWNVLCGDLSIVGPRPRPAKAPAPPARPGLTGLAQLRQLERTLTRAEQLELDEEYARIWSPGLDVRIVGRTMWRVLR